MKKAVFIPDSFKGTMSSEQICGIMERSVKKYYPDAETISIPVADGGEGSVDAFLTAVGGEKIFTTVKGPYFEDMEAFYGLIDNGSTAVIEMAACAGLPLVDGRRDPSKTTTYGVGQLMLDAVNRGCKKIIMCLGGSCTNDAGCGAAAAAGVKFLDANGREFIPAGGTLKDVNSIDLSNLNDGLKGAEIVTMCDIDNPLYGETGAAYIFAPQKGADEAMVQMLDCGLIDLSDTVKSTLGRDLAQCAGAGAAGGMGYGMMIFFDSILQMGIETVLDTVRFNKLIAGADFIFSGEGRIDTQSIRGKVVIGVARRAKNAGIPLIAIVGDIGDDIGEAYENGVSAIFSINRVARDFSKVRDRSPSDLELTMDNLMSFLKTIGK